MRFVKDINAQGHPEERTIHTCDLQNLLTLIYEKKWNYGKTFIRTDHTTNCFRYFIKLDFMDMTLHNDISQRLYKEYSNKFRQYMVIMIQEGQCKMMWPFPSK